MWSGAIRWPRLILRFNERPARGPDRGSAGLIHQVFHSWQPASAIGRGRRPRLHCPRLEPTFAEATGALHEDSFNHDSLIRLVFPPKTTGACSPLRVPAPSSRGATLAATDDQRLNQLFPGKREDSMTIRSTTTGSIFRPLCAARATGNDCVWRSVAIVWAFVLFPCCRSAAAGEGNIAAKPAELAAAVRTAFSAKCVQCHGPSLRRPKGKFGYVLDLERMAANPELVVPSKPEESKLWTLLRDNEMPPPKAKAGPLTADEKELVRAWVAAGAPAETSPQLQDATPARASRNGVIDPDPPVRLAREVSYPGHSLPHRAFDRRRGR